MATTTILTLVFLAAVVRAEVAVLAEWDAPSAEAQSMAMKPTQLAADIVSGMRARGLPDPSSVQVNAVLQGGASLGTTPPPAPPAPGAASTSGGATAAVVAVSLGSATAVLVGVGCCLFRRRRVSVTIPAAVVKMDPQASAPPYSQGPTFPAPSAPPYSHRPTFPAPSAPPHRQLVRVVRREEEWRIPTDWPAGAPGRPI